jgi:hypothetical protein
LGHGQPEHGRLAAGIGGHRPKPIQIAAALTVHYARVPGRPDDTRLHRRRLARLEA